MKTLYYCCALLLFITFLPFPIEYYYFLRIMVTIGAVTILLNEYHNRFTVWFIFFACIALLFNPIFPIYFGIKSYWLPLDILSGFLFLLYTSKKQQKLTPKNKATNNQRITLKKTNSIEEPITHIKHAKKRSRDRFPNS